MKRSEVEEGSTGSTHHFERGPEQGLNASLADRAALTWGIGGQGPKVVLFSALEM